MGITAEQGPFVTFGQAPTFDFNEAAGPNAWYQGDMLLDPRPVFTYQPGEAFNAGTIRGWMSTTSIPIVDQVPSALATTNIVNAQTPTAGTALTVVTSSGAGITVGCAITNGSTGAAVTGLLGIDVNSATNPLLPVLFGQGGDGGGGPMGAWNPVFGVARCIIVTTNGDDTVGFYTVNGYDVYGFPMSQKLTGVNNTTVTTTKAFKFISSIVPSGTIASTSVSVGTTDVFGLPLRADRFPYLGVWWGTPQSLINGGTVANQTVLEVPVTLSALANAQVYDVVVPFDGTVVGIAYTSVVATTTAGKAATLTLQANGSSVTAGGVLALASNTDTSPIGHTKTGSAATAGNTFTAGQTVGFVVSGVTTFVEGSGIVEITVQNSDASGGKFVGAVATSPATQTTGDVRGTFTVPSASDGTKRLTIFWTPIPANMATSAGVWGVVQV